MRMILNIMPRATLITKTPCMSPARSVTFTRDNCDSGDLERAQTSLGQNDLTPTCS